MGNFLYTHEGTRHMKKATGANGLDIEGNLYKQNKKVPRTHGPHIEEA